MIKILSIKYDRIYRMNSRFISITISSLRNLSIKSDIFSNPRISTSEIYGRIRRISHRKMIDIYEKDHIIIDSIGINKIGILLILKRNMIYLSNQKTLFFNKMRRFSSVFLQIKLLL